VEYHTIPDGLKLSKELTQSCYVHNYLNLILKYVQLNQLPVTRNIDNQFAVHFISHYCYIPVHRQ